jgi:hypothetical protein
VFYRQIKCVIDLNKLIQDAKKNNLINELELLFTAENISNDLANYMTMAIDPNVGHIVKFMETELPTYNQLLKDLQKELEEKLKAFKISLPELFHRIAIE